MKLFLQRNELHAINHSTVRAGLYCKTVRRRFSVPCGDGTNFCRKRKTCKNFILKWATHRWWSPILTNFLQKLILTTKCMGSWWILIQHTDIENIDCCSLLFARRSFLEDIGGSRFLGYWIPNFPQAFFKQTRNEQRESQGVENLQQCTIVGFGDAIFKSIKKWNKKTRQYRFSWLDHGRKVILEDSEFLIT